MFFTYTPLVTTDLTTPVQADVTSACVFVLGVGVAILAVGLIIRVFSR